MSPPKSESQARRGALFLLIVLGLGPVLGLAQTFEEFYGKGLGSYGSGDYAEAERQFKAALALGPKTDDLYYHLGMCAAFLGKLDEAERALLAAIGINPSFGEGFTELGGLYFKQRRFPDSERALRKALKLDAGNAYARDLLGTVYFINGSQDRALEEWNKVGKPVLDSLLVARDGTVHPELVKREFRIRPGQLIRASRIRESLKRLDKLDCTSGVSFALQPSPEHPDRADLLYSGSEQRGFGGSPAAALIGGSRDLLQRTVYLNFKNILDRGVNLYSVYRWDEFQKKIGLAVRVPRLLGTPVYYRLGYLDQRERWLFASPDPLGENDEFTLSERELRLDVDYILNDRVSFDHHFRIKRTSYLPISGGDVDGPGTRFLWGGDYAFGVMDRRDAGLTAGLDIHYDVSRPDRASPKAFFKFVLTAEIAGSWARNLSAGSAGRIAGRMTWGHASSATPFDEYFVLGIGPDVEFPLRAYRTTEGRKLGHGPLGREFVLVNVDYLRKLGRLSLFDLDGGLFFDGAKLLDDDPFHRQAGDSLLTDCGVCLVARVFHVSFRISYAHSLTGNRRSFYISSILE